LTKDEALKLALEALEEAHYKIEHKQNAAKREQAITAIRKALAQPAQEPRNFCSRCGKRTADLTVIHTCTPPRGLEMT
jgi:plasmid stabilization system protein ParE